VNSEHDGLKLMMGFGGGVPEVRNARASDSLYAVAIEAIFFKEDAMWIAGEGGPCCPKRGTSSLAVPAMAKVRTRPKPGLLGPPPGGLDKAGKSDTPIKPSAPV
jgi:hypothetical protein